MPIKLRARMMSKIWYVAKQLQLVKLKGPMKTITSQASLWIDGLTSPSKPTCDPYRLHPPPSTYSATCAPFKTPHGTIRSDKSPTSLSSFASHSKPSMHLKELKKEKERRKIWKNVSTFAISTPNLPFQNLFSSPFSSSFHPKTEYSLFLQHPIQLPFSQVRMRRGVLRKGSNTPHEIFVYDLSS